MSEIARMGSPLTPAGWRGWILLFTSLSRTDTQLWQVVVVVMTPVQLGWERSLWVPEQASIQGGLLLLFGFCRRHLFCPQLGLIDSWLPSWFYSVSQLLSQASQGSWRTEAASFLQQVGFPRIRWSVHCRGSSFVTCQAGWFTELLTDTHVTLPQAWWEHTVDSVVHSSCSGLNEPSFLFDLFYLCFYWQDYF